MRAPVLAVLIGLAVQGSQAPARPQILGIAHVRIQTSDLAKARRFYGHVLGYAELAQADRAHSAVFTVNDRQRLIVRDGLPPDRDERLMDLAFETGDVEGLGAHLRGRGLRAGDVFRDAAAGGRGVEVKDPDGHSIQFVEPRPRARTPAAPDLRISRRIQHAGLTVRDPAAADGFYKEVLGFSETWRGGRTDGVISWINMRVPDGTEYLEYMLTTAAPDRRQLGTAHHVALLVSDIQDALERVRLRTAVDDPNHRATPQIGRNNRWQLNLYDPDGTRIELMEPWTVR